MDSELHNPTSDLWCFSAVNHNLRGQTAECKNTETDKMD